MGQYSSEKEEKQEKRFMKKRELKIKEEKETKKFKSA